MLGAVFLTGCASNEVRVRAKDLPRLEQKAQEGDGQAAYRLYQYYEYKAYDARQAARWLKRAEQLGAKEARQAQDYRFEYHVKSDF